MWAGGYKSVLEARTRDEFRDEIVKFTRALGFEMVSAMTVVDQTLGDPDFVTVDNTPASYVDSFNDPIFALRDPVMQHCKQHSMPIIWDQRTYVDQGVGEKWEHQAAYGYVSGIAMAMHLPGGRHFQFGVERDRPLPRDPQELQRTVADLQLFVVMAQDVAMRILVPEPLQPERPALTPRELEALRWTMDGKTAWEVGAILGISERTAVLHISNAMRKLACTTKHQAVLKALRLGLIH